MVAPDALTAIDADQPPVGRREPLAVLGDIKAVSPAGERSQTIEELAGRPSLIWPGLKRSGQSIMRVWWRSMQLKAFRPRIFVIEPLARTCRAQ